MTRHMFISTHNYWFSRLALLSSLIMLSGILLEAYAQLLTAGHPTKEWTEWLQPYFIHGITIVALFLTGAACYLHRELRSYTPFVICLGLLLLAVSQYFVDQWSSFLHLASNATLAQTLVSLFILSLFWWVSSITGPRDHILIDEKDKKYRLWAWLGLFLLFLQIILSAWLTASHANLICTDFLFCNGQLLPKLDFHALITSPLSHDSLINLYMLHQICTIVTITYLSILSIFFIFNRALGEMGILIFLFMLAQIFLGITGWVLQKPLWVIFSHDIFSALLLLTLISLLINLYRKQLESYH